MNRRPIDYESIALPTEPQKHGVRITDTLIHYKKICAKKQAILPVFSYFFLGGDKEFHAAGQELDLDIAAHPLLTVQIPHKVALRPDGEGAAAEQGDAPLPQPPVEEKEHDEGEIRPHARKEPGVLLLTDDRHLDLSVRHAAPPVDGHPRNGAPVHREHEHDVGNERLLSARNA